MRDFNSFFCQYSPIFISLAFLWKRGNLIHFFANFLLFFTPKFLYIFLNPKQGKNEGFWFIFSPVFIHIFYIPRLKWDILIHFFAQNAYILFKSQARLKRGILIHSFVKNLKKCKNVKVKNVEKSKMSKKNQNNLWYFPIS